MSNRTDRRGHWPRGKNRHERHPSWGRLRYRVQRATAGASRSRDFTRRGLADQIGVHDRTLRRWLSGEDLPPPVAVLALKRLLNAAR